MTGAPPDGDENGTLAQLKGGWRVQLVGLVISVISIAAVVWWASRQQAPELPSTAAGLSALAAGVVVYLLITLVRGERWWWLLHHSGAAPSRSDAYGLTAVSYMGNNVLPARGGDVMGVYLMAPRAQTGMRNVIGTLVAARVLDAAAVGLLLMLSLALLGASTPGGGRLVFAGALILLGCTAVLAGYLLRNHPPVRRLIEFIAPMTRATRDLRGRHGVAMVGITVGIWLMESGVYAAVASAAGVEISALEVVYVTALTNVFVAIPSGPGYVGTFDAAVLFAVKAVGASGSEAVSFLIMLRFVLFVPVTVAGLALLLLRYGGWIRAGRPQLEARRA
ncbi:MAG: lysylphosphatidylglycerol synthase transmembrane domain-containing protein [Actinomycetota bacterium]